MKKVKKVVKEEQKQEKGEVREADKEKVKEVRVKEEVKEEVKEVAFKEEEQDFDEKELLHVVEEVMNGKYLSKKKLHEEEMLEHHLKSMFSDLDELNKTNLKSGDRTQIDTMMADVKSMYQTALDIVLRTSMIKLPYL